MKLHKSETAELQATLSLIKEYLKAGNDSVAEESATILAAQLTDPTLFFQYQTTFPGHPAVQEAFIIYDALETVTNGIYDIEILEQLQKIRETSPFYSWKNFILCLKGLYKSDKNTTDQYADMIPTWSATGALKPFLKNFFTAQIRNFASEPLFRDFFDDSTALADSYLAQLMDEAKAGLWKEYTQTSLSFLKDFSSQPYPWHKDFCIHVMDTLFNQDGPFEDFLQGLSPLFPRTCILQWASFALKENDPETGLIYLLQSITLIMVEPLTNNSSLELTLLLDHYSYSEKLQEYFMDDPELKAYAVSLLTELEKKMLWNPNPPSVMQRISKMLLSFSVSEDLSCVSISGVSRKKTATSSVQLELF